MAGKRGYARRRLPRPLDAAILLTWALLTLLDLAMTAVLLVCGAAAAAARLAARALFVGRRGNSHEEPSRVLVVGASFAGLAAYRELLGEDGVEVTLVDFKEYFEYTPGILRCYVTPSYLRQITCALPAGAGGAGGGRFVCGEVTSVGEHEAEVTHADGKVSNLPFDYLLLCIGSTYAAPVKPSPRERTLVERQQTWADAQRDLDKAEHIIVVGAGAVGVELVGEILTVRPEKRVTLVDMNDTVLRGFEKGCVTHADKWLRAKGADLVLAERISAITDTSVTLESGRVVRGDVVYRCTGWQPNTELMKGSPLGAELGFRDAVVVNDFLQVPGKPHIFALGDAMTHEGSKELKLGHTAEVNAHLAAKNVRRMLRRASEPLLTAPLLTYPRGVTGADLTPKIYCVSLGAYEATLAFNGLVISGFLAALTKWLLEWTKVQAARARPIGVVFWIIADVVSNWLGRTLLPTKAT